MVLLGRPALAVVVASLRGHTTEGSKRPHLQLLLVLVVSLLVVLLRSLLLLLLLVVVASRHAVAVANTTLCCINARIATFCRLSRCAATGLWWRRHRAPRSRRPHLLAPSCSCLERRGRWRSRKLLLLVTVVMSVAVAVIVVMSHRLADCTEC